MNKYQEAFNRLVDDDYDFPHDYYEEDKNVAKERDIETLQELLDNQLTQKEIEAILICMSYYSLRNEGKLVNNIDVGFGGELYSKLKQLSEGNDNE